MPTELRSSSQGRTLVLTLHNPDLNAAVPSGVYAAGVEALNVAGDNPDIRSVVVVCEGDTSCAPGALRALQVRRTQPRAEQAEALDTLNLWIDTIGTFPKPVVAAVETRAGGTALSIALACDLIVAARDAQFVLSQARAGLPPDGGALWHLGRALPRNMALELALLGEPVSAERLHALGLVNRLAAPGQALQEALMLTALLDRRAPGVAACTKELLAAAPQQTLARHLAAEREVLLDALAHPHAERAIAALLDGTPPAFD